MNWYPFPGQALAAQTLSIKGREERVEGDGRDVLICAFTPDHIEESLPLPAVSSDDLDPKMTCSSVEWLVGC